MILKENQNPGSVRIWQSLKTEISDAKAMATLVYENVVTRKG